MKKNIFIIAFFFISMYNIFASSCYPNGVVISSQQEVFDLTEYLDISGCNEIEGNLIIEGSDIEDLGYLYQLAKVDGDLIIRNCPALTGVYLTGLKEVGGKFEFHNNDLVINMAGLDSLTTIGGDLIITGNGALETLLGNNGYDSWYREGLYNLTGIGGTLKIENNPHLEDLYGLSSLNSISGHISIKYNDVLSSISGLENINTGVVAIRIVHNPSLTGLDGLENITSTGGGILIEDNELLTDLTGLDGITEIGWHLYIYNNENLESLHGLEGVTTIGKEMKIIGNQHLLNMSGLKNLTSIGSVLEIKNHELLNSLEDLQKLTAIGGILRIVNNYSLYSLKGLDNIDYTTISGLELRSDNHLNTCDVKSICDFLDNGGEAVISDNATGCNSVQEVKETCAPPQCTEIYYPEENQYHVPLDAEIKWEPVEGAVGYYISISTNLEFGWDMVDHKDIGNNTSYQHNVEFPCRTNMYVLVSPYNKHGEALECTYRHFFTVGAAIEVTGDVEICYGDSTILKAYTDTDYTPVTWSPDYALSNSTGNKTLAFPEHTTTYYATVTDEYGCTAIDSVRVKVYPPIDAEITGGPEYLCAGDCSGRVEVTINDLIFNGTFYMYRNGGVDSFNIEGDYLIYINGFCPGDYAFVIVDEHGCSRRLEGTIEEVNPEIHIDSISDVTDYSKGSISVTITNNYRPYGLEWNGLDGVDFHSTEEDISNLEPGCYELTVWDEELHCTTDSIICVADKSATIDEENTSGIDIFPNPAGDMVYIMTSGDGISIITVNIYDVSGKLCMDNIQSKSVDISSLKNGIYFMKIKTNEGFVYKKLLVSK